jgi:hypothetical protein
MGRTTEQGSPLMQPLLVPVLKAEEWRGRGFLTTPLFILTISCFVCYANTVSCGFVFDDISAIKDNKAREQDYKRLIIIRKMTGCLVFSVPDPYFWITDSDPDPASLSVAFKMSTESLFFPLITVLFEVIYIYISLQRIENLQVRIENPHMIIPF